MMLQARDREDFFQALENQVLLPIIRLDDPDLCRQFCREVHAVGFEILEVTLTTPDALLIIQDLSHMDLFMGAGTVTTAKEAELAIAHGARFMVSPGFSAAVAQVAVKANIPYIPGVYTATEVMLALKHGLSQLKFFPAMPAGIEYLGHLKGPFPEVKWIPTGGIAFEMIPDFLRKGVLAIGQGTRLVNKADLMARNWPAVREQLTAVYAQVQSWKQEKLKP